MKNLLISLFILTFFFQSCSDKEVEICDQKCNQEIVCTLNLKAITVQVKDSDDNYVQLDSYRTYRVRDGKEYNHSSDITGAIGYYVVLTDLEKKDATLCGEYFEFVGVIDGEEVIKEKFLIKSDCCHIQLIDGPIEIKTGGNSSN